ncbi:MAG: ABC transporter ATP-binding protein [Burkholderiales bacterium]|nr:ABC transporter ATP-binding protein [Burkholderiales bacterium]
MTVPAPHLRVTDMVAGYTAGRPVLRGVSLSAASGRITVVLGPNGAGKSTLLRVVAGFLAPTSGTVHLDDADISGLPPQAHLAHGVGLLPQGRSIFPELSVSENIELGGWTLRADRKRLREAVDRMFVRYPELRALRDRPAGNLSGGQQRIVEIARLMVSNPRVLLIDEPSAGLSPAVATRVYEELVGLTAEGRTLLLVDQDVRAAVRIAHHVYVLSSGKNDADGDPSAFESDLGKLVRGWLGV